MSKNWTDQPDEVENAKVLCRFYSKSASALFEVRKGHVDDASPYYLTTGNLFGSQTVKAFNPDDIFHLIGVVIDREDSEKIVALPLGMELVA